MTAKTLNLLPNHPFWNFSCHIYEQTRENLLTLQERYNLNVNILLFCLWFAANNHALLTRQDVKQLLTNTHTWHERIVKPLRHLRTRLQDALETVTWAESIRAETLATELAAEHIEELLITEAAPKKAQRRSNRTSIQRATQACQNIVTYCHLLYVYPDDIDCVCVSEILTAVFPELNSQDILSLCRSALGGKQKPVLLGQRQLQLELLME